MTSDARQRRREGSRRARASQERRADGQRRKQKRGVLYAVVGVVVIAAAIALFILLRGGGTELGFSVPLLPAAHEPPYIYNQDVEVDGALARIPPTSGHHFDVPHQGWGYLGEPLVPERVVHNMEHGGVVIWHQPGNPELAGAVNQLVRATGAQCVVAGPYADMSYEVAATVWGRVLPLESFDSDQILEFVDTYRGSQGPEAGLCYREPY